MAFCPKCGSQVADGAPFCSNCGVNLGAPVVNYAAAPAAPSKLGLAFKVLFTKGFSSPLDGAEESSILHPAAALIMWGAYALLAFFMMMIHLPLGEAGGGRYISIGSRTLFGLGPLFVITLSTLIRAGLGYAFGKSSNPKFTFMQLFAQFGALKLYPLCLYFLMFLFGLFSPLLAMIMLAVGLIIWVGLSDALLIKYLGNLSETRRNWFLILISGIAFFVSVLFLYLFTRATIGNILPF